MEYKIEEIEGGQNVIIALPLEIAKVNYSFEYFDHNLKRMRSTHPDFWVVNEKDGTPWNMKVDVNEFKEVHTAVEHAVRIYLKYLREELKRVRDADGEP